MLLVDQLCGVLVAGLHVYEGVPFAPTWCFLYNDLETLLELSVAAGHRLTDDLLLSIDTSQHFFYHWRLSLSMRAYHIITLRYYGWLSSSIETHHMIVWLYRRLSLSMRTHNMIIRLPVWFLSPKETRCIIVQLPAVVIMETYHMIMWLRIVVIVHRNTSHDHFYVLIWSFFSLIFLPTNLPPALLSFLVSSPASCFFVVFLWCHWWWQSRSTGSAAGVNTHVLNGRLTELKTSHAAVMQQMIDAGNRMNKHEKVIKH